MRRIVEDRGLVPKTDFFNRFLIVYSHYRDIAKCEKIYDKMLELKLVPDSNTFGSLGGLYALTVRELGFHSVETEKCHRENSRNWPCYWKMLSEPERNSTKRTLCA